MRKLPDVSCRYGAPHGRNEYHVDDKERFDGRLHLRHAPLDSGGYDEGGAYWGQRPLETNEVECLPIGETRTCIRRITRRRKLYWYWYGDNGYGTPIISGFVDAFDRKDAKAIVAAIYPNATFHR